MLADTVTFVPTVATAAAPDVSWLPPEFTPGRSMLPVPSKDTPPIVRAEARAVAVAALPVQDPDEPDAFPVKFAVIVPAEKSPEPSLNTIVLAVLALVALDVTVNVPPSLLTEPEIPLPDVPNFDSEWNEKCFLRADLLPGIYKYFEDYGVEYFEPLDIWHIPQLKNYFIKQTGRQPRS